MAHDCRCDFAAGTRLLAITAVAAVGGAALYVPA